MPTTDPLATVSTALSPAGWRLEHSYAGLPALFHATVAPTPVREPGIVVVNRELAAELGLEPPALETEEAAAWFTGNALPPGARPLAQAYAGHQYGHFTVLGDGRALLLGEQITPEGLRRDIQLKGSGPTPFSRRGDGRAALGPMLREYVISEAMHALGIPTTRSLAVATTGETVWRESALPGAVLTRVADSHLRVGTFEWAAARGDTPALQALVEYALQRHYADLAATDQPALALLNGVVTRQAALLARWMLVGFVHGVMNTDNMAISGETIDYGPCAFLDHYDPRAVFSSIDAHGRYAYGNQPAIAQWNLARLAEALLPLLAPDEPRAIEVATGAVQRFGPEFERHWFAGMRQKLGLSGEEPGDRELIADLLAAMEETKADFTNTFADLTQEPAACAEWPPALRSWRERWTARFAREAEPAEIVRTRQRLHCPAVIPRNHRVEGALSAAVAGDLAPLHALLAVLRRPYAYDQVSPVDRTGAPEGAEPYRTFCGT